MVQQKTLTRPTTYSGIGLHTGNLTTLIFQPAPPGHGIAFVRSDVPGAEPMAAVADGVVDVSRGTTLEQDGLRIHTVEHVMAAVSSLGITNLLIAIDGDEMPIADGSSLPFLEAFQKAGLTEQDGEEVPFVRLRKPMAFEDGDVWVRGEPADHFEAHITISFPHPVIGTQSASIRVSPETFTEEVGPARTFCFLHEVKALKQMGLIKGGSMDNAIVIGEDGILNDGLRFENEFARHKLLDLIGDLALIGHPIKGRIEAHKSGHGSHVAFARMIRQAIAENDGAVLETPAAK
jgi:UDP-3-O-acyl N-acetylglucosamine deacetylase